MKKLLLLTTLSLAALLSSCSKNEEKPAENSTPAVEAQSSKQSCTVSCSAPTSETCDNFESKILEKSECEKLTCKKADGVEVKGTHDNKCLNQEAAASSVKQEEKAEVAPEKAVEEKQPEVVAENSQEKTAEATAEPVKTEEKSEQN